MALRVVPQFLCNFFNSVVNGDAKAVAFTNDDTLKTLRQSQTVFRANSFDVRECWMMVVLFLRVFKSFG